MPQAVDCTGFRCGYSRPSMTIRPPGSGCSTPEIILISVDLPDPFSPTRQCTSPARNERSTSRNATTPPKCLEIEWTSRKLANSGCPRHRRQQADSPCRSQARTASPVRDSRRSEAAGDKPRDRLVVDPHDLVDLDQLARYVDGRLAQPRD